ARCTLAVTMASSGQTFREFEQAGWETASVVAKYHEHISSVTTQSVEALLDAADIRSGSRVLDVATGAGYIADAAAQRGADAIGIDFSAVQGQMARDRYPSVRFEQADAEALPFDPQSFDAVVSGFGMCHFPNPDIALREAFRVLKAGGRIAFTVWDKRAVGFGAVYAAIRAHGSLDVGLPAGPNFVLVSDPEQGMKALLTAGFASPSCVRCHKCGAYRIPTRFSRASSRVLCAQLRRFAPKALLLGRPSGPSYGMR